MNALDFNNIYNLATYVINLHLVWGLQIVRLIRFIAEHQSKNEELKMIKNYKYKLFTVLLFSGLFGMISCGSKDQGQTSVATSEEKQLK